MVTDKIVPADRIWINRVPTITSYPLAVLSEKSILKTGAGTVWSGTLSAFVSPYHKELVTGGTAWDPGGAEWPTAESSGPRRRKAMSTSGWRG